MCVLRASGARQSNQSQKVCPIGKESIESQSTVLLTVHDREVNVRLSVCEFSKPNFAQGTVGCLSFCKVLLKSHGRERLHKKGSLEPEAGNQEEPQNPAYVYSFESKRIESRTDGSSTEHTQAPCQSSPRKWDRLQQGCAARCRSVEMTTDVWRN